MTDAKGSPSKAATPSKSLSHYKGSTNVLAGLDERSSLNSVRRDVADAMNSKNVSFLLGSGCSSAIDIGGVELGIPTMKPMAASLLNAKAGKHRITDTDRAKLKSSLGLDLGIARYAENLESLMEVLFASEMALRESSRDSLRSAHATILKVIAVVREYILEVCSVALKSGSAVSDTYERFYRRLVQRDSSLPRPWVFTTNYDLFNESAMDRLGIPYINGFLGSIERRFNPAAFRYSLSEQLDISSRRWTSVDSLVYFAKLHGSVSWESRDDGLFPVVETAPERIGADRLLIYPTPAKQNASFASPYSDMFREFQSRTVRDQSVLVTVGYSFGDEHVNNIIFQALTVPTFRLVAFVDPNANDIVKRLRFLDDPRIWLIGTEDAAASWKSHYFASVVAEFLAVESSAAADDAIGRVLTEMLGRAGTES